jgi:hypothetical protein
MKQQNRFSEWMRAMPTRNDWLKGEPQIREMLTDPIVRLVMRRDNLDPSDVWAAVHRARAAMYEPAETSRDVA